MMMVLLLNIFHFVYAGYWCYYDQQVLVVLKILTLGAGTGAPTDVIRQVEPGALLSHFFYMSLAASPFQVAPIRSTASTILEKTLYSIYHILISQ